MMLRVLKQNNDQNLPSQSQEPNNEVSSLEVVELREKLAEIKTAFGMIKKNYDIVRKVSKDILKKFHYK